MVRRGEEGRSAATVWHGMVHVTHRVLVREQHVGGLEATDGGAGCVHGVHRLQQRSGLGLGLGLGLGSGLG
eukprot:scaffold56734_cov45-Phaeocystis_antarctica.AAC.2